MNVIDEDVFLAKKGVGFIVSNYNLDKIVLPHGKTRKQRQRRLKTGEIIESRYQAKRAAAKAEYAKLVASGKVRPLTTLERTYQKAVYGHPDNTSTQAARRLLEKRGFIMVYQN